MASLTTETPRAEPLIGPVVGLVISFNIISDSAEPPSWDSLSFSVPWLSRGLICLVVHAVSLVTTLIPAVRASRVYPAEPVRYQ